MFQRCLAMSGRFPGLMKTSIKSSEKNDCRTEFPWSDAWGGSLWATRRNWLHCMTWTEMTNLILERGESGGIVSCTGMCMQGPMESKVHSTMWLQVELRNLMTKWNYFHLQPVLWELSDSWRSDLVFLQEGDWHPHRRFMSTMMEMMSIVQVPSITRLWRRLRNYSIPHWLTYPVASITPQIATCGQKFGPLGDKMLSLS